MAVTQFDREALAPERTVRRVGSRSVTWGSTTERFATWRREHRRDLLALTAVLIIVGGVHAWGMYNAPARFDDEGTYVSQAWATNNGELAHYTYWYDHPPAGWIQLGAVAAITNTFDAAPNAVGTGRFVMLLVKLITAALLFVLARRLSLSRPLAAAAVVLFGVSPLALGFSRMVFLDSIALAWLMAACVLAVSPRRSIWTAAGSGACFAMCVLSKETFLLSGIGWAWLLLRESSHHNRRFCAAVGLGSAVIGIAAYPLFALLRGEMFPGDGHVSLWDAVMYQLSGREGSGFILDPHSGAYGLLKLWLNMDPVLPVVGLIAAFVVMWKLPRWRPVMVVLLVPALAMFRGGYLPYPSMIQMMPFLALACVGLVSIVVGQRPHRADALLAMSLASLLIASALWTPTLAGLVSDNQDRAMSGAQAWLKANATPADTLVVDDALWLDFVNAGWSTENVVWFYKIDLDSGVQLPDGGRGVDYLAFPPLPADVALPKLREILDRSTVVATFGDGANAVTVYDASPDNPIPASPAAASPAAASNDDVANSRDDEPEDPTR